MEQFDTRTYDLDDLEADAWGRCGWEGFPEMSHAGGGVESHYDARIAREILRRVLEGETVKAIAADPDLPSYSTIFVWLRRRADFRWRWRAARRHLAEGRVNTIDLTERSRPAWHRLRKTVEGGPLRGQGGRRSSYTRAKARAVCRRMARGETVSAICADPRMPSAKALYGWLRRNPRFRAMFVDARAEWLSWLEEEILGVLAETVPTSAGVQTANRRIAELDGRIGRLTPKTYRLGSIREG